ncbi:MAG TPA: hypothetical protein DD381_07560 [Lentisphaeria bacterium]|nr:MAG: hypothetical protein A2X47_04140 [Lentisphaerae bacterium GWF2_38_69]HBM16179.1 hypothetical protein [Lentisphaeria bacterium]
MIYNFSFLLFFNRNYIILFFFNNQENQCFWIENRLLIFICLLFYLKGANIKLKFIELKLVDKLLISVNRIYKKILTGCSNM